MNFIVGLIMNEAFQVTAIIEKLPPLWKDFRNYLKQKMKEITVEDLIVRFCIEKNNKTTERRLKENSIMSGANIVEDDPNNSKKRKKVGQQSNPPKKKLKGSALIVAKLSTSQQIVMYQRKAKTRIKPI